MGLNPDLLDNPDAPISAAGDEWSGGGGGGGGGGGRGGDSSGDEDAPAADAAGAVAAAPPGAAVMSVSQDPAYAEYFRGLRMGVPKAALIAKMESRGQDPNILDMDPDAPSPNVGAIVAAEVD
jgi:hypothetical protein